MDLHGWDECYRAAIGSKLALPAPLVKKTALALTPGRALDLACGEGRNVIWLAERGWHVTAVDGSEAAIEAVRRHAAEQKLLVKTHIADLERGGYSIGEACWDLIAISYYLQRDLFEPAKRGAVPGGVVVAIVHIPELGCEPTRHSLLPGELASYFAGWEILHSYEGSPRDPEHRRRVAEVVARKPCGIAG